MERGLVGSEMCIRDRYTTWVDLQEDIITDNDVHTDLEPLDAPLWSIGVQFEQSPHCLLGR